MSSLGNNIAENANWQILLGHVFVKYKKKILETVCAVHGRVQLWPSVNYVLLYTNMPGKYNC